MKLIFMIVICLGLMACSATSSNVRELMDTFDRSELGDISLAIGANQIQTTSQGDSSIFKLHHQGPEVVRIAKEVAQFYGFKLADSDEAVFYLDLTKAVPDGGACLDWVRSVKRNLTFTASVLTLGVLPTRAGHCLEVDATLYYTEGNEHVNVGDFTSSAGLIDVYAGANEVDNYRLTVDPADEVLGLETSIGGLFNNLLSENAFKIDLDQ